MLRIRIKYMPLIKCAEDMVGKWFTNGDIKWKYTGIKGSLIQYIIHEEASGTDDDDIIEFDLKEEYESYRMGYYQLTSPPYED